MPSTLGSGAAFTDLIAARCQRAWVSLNEIENGVPDSYRCHVARAKLWGSKDRQTYDKMVKAQKKLRDRSQRRENPVLVACPHRLRFVFNRDDEVPLEAQHLVMVCAGESLSDWSGADGPLFGGSRGRADLEYALRELQTSWSAVTRAFESNQQIGAPASSALFTRVFNLLARRYERYAAILPPGRVREELLANVARQLAEIRVYFHTFNEKLADRCGRRPYEEQAYYAGSRYMTLLKPVVTFLLDAEDGAADLGSLAGSAGSCAGGGGGTGFGAGFGTPFAATFPPPARRKLAVTFADGAGGPSFLPPQAPPQPAPLPASPGPSGWPGYPGYSASPAAYYYPPAGAAYTQPAPGPPISPTAAGGPWSGYAGPISGSPGSAASAASPAAASPPVAAPAKPVIKPDPGASASLQGFLSQPMHVYVTGVNYNVVPAGECRAPPCGCGAKHGPNYRPGPHATWDCPFRYMARYGSCPGFLSNGQRNPNHWHGDALTRRAKDEWVTLITKLNLPLPSGADFRPVNFAL